MIILSYYYRARNLRFYLQVQLLLQLLHYKLFFLLTSRQPFEEA